MAASSPPLSAPAIASGSAMIWSGEKDMFAPEVNAAIVSTMLAPASAPQSATVMTSQRDALDVDWSIGGDG